MNKQENGIDIAAISIPIQVMLGSTAMTVAELAAMGEGTVLELDSVAGEPVTILAMGREIARGEVVVIDENFGVRVTGLVGRMDQSREGK